MDFDLDIKSTHKMEIKTPSDIITLLKRFATGYQHFYVLGGSQCDIHYTCKVNEDSDIDLFFETEEDFDRMKYQIPYVMKMKSSKYAETYSIDGWDIQLIKHRFGNVNHHFDNFDINKSRIGFEFKGNIDKFIEEDITRWVHKSFHEKLEIDFRNFRVQTPDRLIKYTKKIGSRLIIPHNQNTIFKIIEYCSEHFDDVIENYYEDRNITGSIIMSNFVKKLIKYTNNMVENHQRLVNKVRKCTKHLSIIKQLSVWEWVETWNINNQKYFQLQFFYLLHPVHFFDKIDKYHKLKYPYLFI